MVVVPSDSRMLRPQRSPKNWEEGGGEVLGATGCPAATKRGCTATAAPLHPYRGSEFHPSNLSTEL